MKGPVASNSFYCPISMELMADPVSWKLCAYPIRREAPLVLGEPARLQPGSLSEIWLA